jgi:hypothetical protein
MRSALSVGSLVSGLFLSLQRWQSELTGFQKPVSSSQLKQLNLAYRFQPGKRLLPHIRRARCRKRR